MPEETLSSPTVSENILDTPTVVDHCDICDDTDENRLVGFGLRCKFRKGEIDWIKCHTCKKRFHLFCLGLNKSDVPELDWICESC